MPGCDAKLPGGEAEATKWPELCQCIWRSGRGHTVRTEPPTLRLWSRRSILTANTHTPSRYLQRWGTVYPRPLMTMKFTERVGPKHRMIFARFASHSRVHLPDGRGSNFTCTTKLRCAIQTRANSACSAVSARSASLAATTTLSLISLVLIISTLIEC